MRASKDGPRAPSSLPSFEARRRGEHLRMTACLLKRPTFPAGVPSFRQRKFHLISNTRYTSAFSRRETPEVCLSLSLERGSRECRMRAAPAVSCAKLCKKAAHEHTGQRRTSDIPCAMALRLISRSPRGIGLSCPRRLRIAGSSAPGRADLPSTDLTPTIEASGPHDFAVRFDTARLHVPKTAHGVYPALRSHRAHDAAASTTSHPNVR